MIQNTFQPNGHLLLTPQTTVVENINGEIIANCINPLLIKTRCVSGNSLLLVKLREYTGMTMSEITPVYMELRMILVHIQCVTIIPLILMIDLMKKNLHVEP